jgi:hypothetical protein
MKLQQLSVFLENKKGSIHTICEVLAGANLNIRTLTLADTAQFGILRLILKEWETACDVLKANGNIVRVTEVIALGVDDTPGGLARILKIVESAGISVEYMYAFTLKRRENAVMVFRFEDADLAIRVLSEHGIPVLNDQDLFAE